MQLHILYDASFWDDMHWVCYEWAMYRIDKEHFIFTLFQAKCNYTRKLSRELRSWDACTWHSVTVTLTVLGLH